MGTLVLFPDFRGKAFNLSPLSMTLGGLSICGVCCVVCIPPVPNLLSVYHEQILHFVTFFSVPDDDHGIFLSVILLNMSH